MFAFRMLPVLVLLALSAPAVAHSAGAPAAPASPATAPVPLSVAAPGVNSASPEQPALMPVPEYGMSFREAWRYGGNIMWILGGMSVFGLALTIYLLGVLRESQIAPQRLLGDVLGSIQSGDLAGVRRLCDEHPCPLAFVTLAAVDHVRQTARSDAALLRDAVVAEGTRQADRVQGQTQLLLDLGVIAPMLGLLGTVMGMLKAFGSVAQDVASAKPVVLAAGVSQAIITTIFGLIVAIYAMVAYAYFRRRATRQIAQLESAATSIATVLMGRFDR
jgi:biopolymer transport protein ExbB